MESNCLVTKSLNHDGMVMTEPDGYRFGSCTWNRRLKARILGLNTYSKYMNDRFSNVFSEIRGSYLGSIWIRSWRSPQTPSLISCRMPLIFFILDNQRLFLVLTSAFPKLIFFQSCFWVSSWLTIRERYNHVHFAWAQEPDGSDASRTKAIVLPQYIRLLFSIWILSICSK